MRVGVTGELFLGSRHSIVTAISMCLLISHQPALARHSAEGGKCPVSASQVQRACDTSQAAEGFGQSDSGWQLTPAFVNAREATQKVSGRCESLKQRMQGKPGCEQLLAQADQMASDLGQAGENAAAAQAGAEKAAKDTGFDLSKIMPLVMAGAMMKMAQPKEESAAKADVKQAAPAREFLDPRVGKVNPGLIPGVPAGPVDDKQITAVSENEEIAALGKAASASHASSLAGGIPDSPQDIQFYMDQNMLGTVGDVVKAWIDSGQVERANHQIDDLKNRGSNLHMILANDLQTYLTQR